MSRRPRPTAEPSGFFVLRTPLLPFSQAVAWGADAEAAAHLEDGTLDEALARDRTTLRRRLEDVVTAPDLRDAVFVASPSLEAAIDGWRKDPDGERGRSAEQALVAYFLRAASRPTPFGLFAGCTTGRLGDRTDLRLGERGDYRRHTRLDMDYLWTLAAAIESDPALRHELVFRPNSSLYDVGERFFFAEAQQKGGSRSYHLVAVEKTPYLTGTLERARSGARLRELAEALVGDDITLADADEYLDELVDSQVLVSDVRPQLTGPPPTDTLIATLDRAAGTMPLADRLRAAVGELRAIDDGGLGASPQQYRDVGAQLAELPAAPDLSRLVQVDLVTHAPGLVLGTDVVDELLRGADILHAVARSPAEEALARFREQFTRRYETREVPLAEALDEENGIGFDRSTAASAEAAPLLAGLPFGRRDAPSASWTALDRFLLARLASALAEGRHEIALDPTDIDRIRPADPMPLPDAFEVLAELVSPSEEALARGEFQVVMTGVAGPSGVRLVGRFCHADEQLHRLAAAHLMAEEAARPDAVFAEVVHLPEGRVGNILSRPVLRDHEIPFLGRSGAPPDRQLELSDLTVSVDGDRIVLRSRRLSREVLPRLTTAHQHARGLGIYRFLCALQHQGVQSGLFWDWGPLASAPFLPRVTSGRVVLSRARWNLGREDLSPFEAPPGSGQFAAVQGLRTRHGMPRYVALAEADNELFVDLENVLSVEALARQVRRRPFATLVEVTAQDELCVSGPDGRFTHQLLVPFVRQAADPSPAPRTVRTPAPVPRRFPPGSEWLYLKLFTGPATADRGLDRAGAAVETALARGAADRWFFLRYGDPDWHLRIRVHGRPDSLLGEVLPLVNRAVSPELRSGQLWRVALDTYEREVERYGGDRGIELAEQIFWADSVAALDVVRATPGDAGADLRWRAALLGIDRLFDDLGLSLDERRAVAGTARRGYGREFGTDGTFQREVGRRLRQERPQLEELLDPAAEPVDALAACTRALQQRSAAVAPIGRELRSLGEDGQLTVALGSLALSLAHMHVNRVLRSAQRAQELVLYEMLDRLYTSRAARRSG